MVKRSMISSRPRNLPAALALSACAPKSRKIGCAYAWPCEELTSTANCQSPPLRRAVPRKRALNLSVARLPLSLLSVIPAREISNVQAPPRREPASFAVPSPSLIPLTAASSDPSLRP
jgi:hypothetical protein